MITNLIPLSTFVLELSKKETGSIYSNADSFQKIVSYAHFLQQKPTLSMFIACVDGVPVSEPKEEDYFRHQSNTFDDDDFTTDMLTFQQAQDNVLFSGFKILKKYDNAVRLIFPSFEITFWDSEKHPLIGTTDIHTIEDLTRYNLPLTTKAQNIIYGK